MDILRFLKQVNPWPWFLLLAVNLVVTSTAIAIYAPNSLSPMIATIDVNAPWGFILIMVCPILAFVANIFFSRAFEDKHGVHAIVGLVFSYTSILTWGVVSLMLITQPSNF